MRQVWRFYVDSDQRWRWQKMSPDREVIGESPASFECYEECVTAAKTAGYKFERAQAGSRRSPSIMDFDIAYKRGVGNGRHVRG